MDRKNINAALKSFASGKTPFHFMVWRIPKHRILGFEKFFEIKKGSRLGGIWECPDCHEGAVILGTYKNIHGEIVKIDPKSLDPDTEVMRF